MNFDDLLSMHCPVFRRFPVRWKNISQTCLWDSMNQIESNDWNGTEHNHCQTTPSHSNAHLLLPQWLAAAFRSRPPLRPQDDILPEVPNLHPQHHHWRWSGRLDTTPCTFLPKTPLKFHCTNPQVRVMIVEPWNLLRGIPFPEWLQAFSSLVCNSPHHRSSLPSASSAWPSTSPVLMLDSKIEQRAEPKLIAIVAFRTTVLLLVLSFSDGARDWSKHLSKQPLRWLTVQPAVSCVGSVEKETTSPSGGPDGQLLHQPPNGTGPASRTLSLPPHIEVPLTWLSACLGLLP